MILDVKGSRQESDGTPGYRAPEVLLALPKYDGRVDTFVKIS
jgi:serine/threonine protein kinase